MPSFVAPPKQLLAAQHALQAYAAVATVCANTAATLRACVILWDIACHIAAHRRLPARGERTGHAALTCERCLTPPGLVGSGEGALELPIRAPAPAAAARGGAILLHTHRRPASQPRRVLPCNSAVPLVRSFCTGLAGSRAASCRSVLYFAGFSRLILCCP